MRKTMLLLSGLALLGGCAKAGIYAMSPEELEGQSTVAVARAYGNNRGGLLVKADEFETELRRRGAFTDEQWERIAQRDLRPGDTMAFAYASWGPPDDAVSRDGLDGNSSVWRFGNNTSRPGVYGDVIFTGQLVVAIDR